MRSLFNIRTRKELETSRRIKIAIWAYAYEFTDQPLVTDATFDEECKKVDLSVDTSRPDLDAWFRQNFHAFTGQWIHKHPELDKIKNLHLVHHLNRDIYGYVE